MAKVTITLIDKENGGVEFVCDPPTLVLFPRVTEHEGRGATAAEHLGAIGISAIARYNKEALKRSSSIIIPDAPKLIV